MAHAAVCVFCGARDGHDPAFLAAAEDTGRMLAMNGWELVYGAGDVGLMGAVARAAQGAGGRTLGVIPEHLVAREGARRDLTRHVVTETMHERKKVMFMNSHAIVVLPGGAGSLDEVFEVLTWRQLGLHDKPIFLLNTNDYWAPLIHLVEHVIAHGFAEPGLRDMIRAVADPQALGTALRAALS
jgi:uncharacterized protein (TIGR00730 family)